MVLERKSKNRNESKAVVKLIEVNIFRFFS